MSFMKNNDAWLKHIIQIKGGCFGKTLNWCSGCAIMPALPEGQDCQPREAVKAAKRLLDGDAGVCDSIW